MAKESALVLDRKDKMWVCSECKKEYKDIPGQCSCGATARLFDEKDVPIGEDAEREEYLVNTNILYSGEQVNKGKIISLVKKDRVTLDMVKRKLITSTKKV